MIRKVRAAAVAAAAAAFAVTAGWGAPVQAYQGDAAMAETPWSAHAAANPGISVLGLNADAPAAPDADDGIGGLIGHLATLAGFEPPQPRPLDEQVAEAGGAETRTREEECLASAVYFEARGELLEGQLAVAEVVMNRAASGRYPASLCGVVAQRSQFSFVRGGIIPRADRGSDAWRRAVGVARIAQAGAVRMLPPTVLWYHASYVSPGWGRRLERESRIGAHIFYR